MKFRPYPRYRDSGMGWLGELPGEWTTTLLKRGYDVVLGKMLQPDAGGIGDGFLPYVRAGNIRWDGVDVSNVNEMWVSRAERRQLRLAKGDLLVSEGGDVALRDLGRRIAGVLLPEFGKSRTR